jgi:STE24 endopeptidase
MIWGWGMPASLWYFSGSVLAFFNGVDLTEQTLPYFNDTLQGAIFLVLQHFLSAAMNKGFELFEIFDIDARHDTNRMDIALYAMDNLKSTLLLMVLGLPAFWLFMWLIEIGGNVFFILLLVFTIGILVVYKYLYTNFIAPWFNKFEELPAEIPGLPGLRDEIEEMAKMKEFPLTHIYKVDASKRTGLHNAAVIGFGKH